MRACGPFPGSFEAVSPMLCTAGVADPPDQARGYKGLSDEGHKPATVR